MSLEKYLDPNAVRLMRYLDYAKVERRDLRFYPADLLFQTGIENQCELDRVVNNLMAGGIIGCRVQNDGCYEFALLNYVATNNSTTKSGCKLDLMEYIGWLQRVHAANVVGAKGCFLLTVVASEQISKSRGFAKFFISDLLIRIGCRSTSELHKLVFLCVDNGYLSIGNDLGELAISFHPEQGGKRAGPVKETRSKEGPIEDHELCRMIRRHGLAVLLGPERFEEFCDQVVSSVQWSLTSLDWIAKHCHVDLDAVDRVTERLGIEVISIDDRSYIYTSCLHAVTREFDPEEKKLPNRRELKRAARSLEANQQLQQLGSDLEKLENGESK